MNTHRAALLVIGGGMAGIMAAYRAARHGLEVRDQDGPPGEPS
jgi:succinate dehydrogenase/fumarate reductase flavoprotein subunit